MKIKIKEISKETFEKNGWKLLPNNQVYHKIFNECTACIRLLGDLSTEYYMQLYERVTPDDLIAIGNELKKLEEN